jgi:hypothetical protein
LSARIALLIFSLAATPLLSAADDEPDTGSQDVLGRYLEVSKSQQQQMRGVRMAVDIQAELPKLKKKGHLQALRQISRLGRITYDALRFEGDNTIKKEVIARFLTTEVESTDKTAPPITPEYYKFKYKGLVEKDGKKVHWFQISPRKKLAGTFKGDLWLDPDTYLAVREAGRLVKNPSVFVKKFEFIRTYIIRDGMAIPKQTLGVVQTRLWGKAEMAIDYSDFCKAAETASVPSELDLANRP